MRGSSLSFVASLVCTLAASSAAAQPVVQELRIDGFNQLTGLNAESCADTGGRALRIDIRGLDRLSYTMNFIRYPDSAPNAPCPTDLLDPEIVDVDSQDVDTPNGRLDATYTVTNEDIIGDDCTSEEGGRGNIHFCVQLVELPGDTDAVIAAGVEVLYDTSIPEKPTIDDIEIGDSKVTVVVEEPDTTESYTTIVEYRACADEVTDAGTVADAGTEETEATVESECGATGKFSKADDDDFSVTIGGLSSSEKIELRARFEDDFGNLGPATSLKVVSPTKTVGPLGLYDGEENAASCEASCADTASVAPFVMLGGLTRRGRRALRRARNLLVSLALLLGLAWPTAARADFGQSTVGLGVSPYKPAIDSETVGGKRIFPIYDCFFDGATLLEIGGDVDTHLFDGFGSLQLTTGLSLAQAQGFAQPPTAASTGSCQDPTETEVQLTFMKVRPGLTYRFDPLLDWIGFPLVPYGRVGAVVAGYAFTKDGDFDQGGDNPVGLRFGWEGALGLMLALDFLDSIDPFVPDTTRRARANGVFDHTFLFVEGAYQDITTFGQPGFVLTPVDALIGTGWPVLWKLGVAVELL